ncbi:MAG: M23 family metallopeptidase [Clostridia bacterium]|nr:M23 family metallopeptidase [Clostridia bacterium]
MQKNLASKFMEVLKKYSYWIALAVALVALITVMVLAISHKSSMTPPEEEFTPVVSQEINFANPVSITNVSKDYSNSALQYNNTLRLWQSHKAIDFAAEEGTEVYAVLDGKIADVTYNYLMGNIVKLDVGNGMIVVYASLSNDVPVKIGDTVTKGTVIGYVSNTAKTEVNDGPHLHLEVILDEEKVDPNLYLDLSEK